ncbi:MAG: retroviral-like aspartic protease family protein [Verrucomicrobia bacterium]|nr:retroviral-like aspartic protease family protein [Verrucomicrobiota bacterium]
MKAATSKDNGIGEVRTKVRLTNIVDELLAEAGKLKPNKIRSCEADALVDTGAVRSVIPPHLLRRLGLRPTREQVVEYADGRKEAVGLVRGVGFEIMSRDTSDDALVLGDVVLIGQTVLEKLDLLMDLARRRLVPNPAHPDQPVSKL